MMSWRAGDAVPASLLVLVWRGDESRATAGPAMSMDPEKHGLLVAIEAMPL